MDIDPGELLKRIRGVTGKTAPRCQQVVLLNINSPIHFGATAPQKGALLDRILHAFEMSSIRVAAVLFSSLSLIAIVSHKLGAASAAVPVNACEDAAMQTAALQANIQPGNEISAHDPKK